MMPGSEGVWLGLLSTALVAGAGFVIVARVPMALLAALFFTMTPVVALALLSAAPQARLLPVVAGWLMLTLVATVHGQRVAFWLAGLCLGAGLYLHPAGLLTMPLLLVVGVTAARAAGLRLFDRRLLVMSAAVAVMALPLAADGSVGRLATSYGVYDGGRFNVLQGMREVFSWVGLVARTEVYYDYFNPSLWFLAGGSIRSALADPHAFLLPLAVLVPAGIHGLVSRHPSSVAVVVIGGLLVAPVAAALTAQPPAPSRLVMAAPCVAVIAMCGAAHLVASGRAGIRSIGVAAAAAVPVCYGWWQLS